MKKEATNPEAYEAPKAEMFTIVLEGGILDSTNPDGEGGYCDPDDGLCSEN